MADLQLQIIRENEEGRVAVRGNAFMVDALNPDAAEVRVGAPKVDGQSSGGGKFSYDVNLPNGTKREICLMPSGEGVNGAEWSLILLKKDGQTVDADYIKVLEATAAGVECRVPFKAPNLGQTSGRFMHEGGRFCTVFQDDGHQVTYDTSTTPWRAMWGNWEGLIVALPWV